MTRTFPEYQHLWQKWEPTDLPEEELKNLLGYMASVFPERFFDILYQNNEIFQQEKAQQINVYFLPGVDFRLLFTLNISENTRQTLWKYLQLIMFQIMEEVKNKAAFGETANIFEGIKEEDLHKKLQETFENLQNFFTSQNAGEPNDLGKMFEGFQEAAGAAGAGATSESEDKGTSGGSSGPPFSGINMEKLQEHLKKLMEGRIGSLVKDLMHELKDDFESFQDELKKHMGDDYDKMNEESGEAGGKAPDMSAIMKHLMKDPTKLMQILKKVTEKLKTHMTPENQQEYMRETMDIMKEMGGREEFMKVFEQMKHNMGGMGKNMRVDQNALVRMEKNAAMKERMRRNLEEKKKDASKEGNHLEKREDGTQVFKIEGQEQPKTTSKEEIERLMKEYGLHDETEEVKQSKKKKNKKKNHAQML